MSASAYHQNKVRLTVECSIDERAYIKMIAAKKHLTISDLLLAPVRKVIPCSKSHKPNAETIKALKESRKGSLKGYTTVDDFWTAMGIDPNA